MVDVDVQREVISCLPEIVDDQQHSEVSKQLRWAAGETFYVAVLRPIETSDIPFYVTVTFYVTDL